MYIRKVSFVDAQNIYTHSGIGYGRGKGKNKALIVKAEVNYKFYYKIKNKMFSDFRKNSSFRVYLKIMFIAKLSSTLKQKKTSECGISYSLSDGCTFLFEKLTSKQGLL